VTKNQRYIQPFTHICQLKLIPPTGCPYFLSLYLCCVNKKSNMIAAKRYVTENPIPPIPEVADILFLPME
ncbi:hypothetical protein, partial [Leyella stercorea]|uniref:hypothetical protein n=1 Tax=Leyella stercorea TaxID=363265 RepID=UPI001F4223AA